MGDITSTIRFIADASQAIGTMRALAAEASALNQSVARIQTQLISKQTGSNAFASSKSSLYADIAGVGINGGRANQLTNLPPTTAIDQFNKTLRTTHEAIVLNNDGLEIFRSKLTNTSGDLREIEQAVTRYGAATKATADHISAMNGEIVTQQSTVTNALAPGRQRVAQLVDEKNAIKDNLTQLRTLRSTMSEPRPTTFKSSAEDLATNQARARAVRDVDAAIIQHEQALRQAISQQGAATRDVNKFEKTDPIIQQAKARITSLQNLLPQTEAAAANLISRSQAAIDAAVKRAPPLPAALETVRQESPKLFNKLTQQGLLGGVGPDGKGIVDTKKIYESGADQLRLTRDLERGTTSLTGTLRNEAGVLTNVSAAYAEGGRVIGRYGGALSGVQNFFRQTVNNLQKVVQWGLATTVMFAGLGLATSAVSTIKSLDASLNQLSITAQLTATQTGAVFDDLAKIAYQTSTPLLEMVKAADDIALATKRANQSTVEWQGNIKSLANSVGILTNITGLDTVKATDLLTSTMKQLNLEASDLPSILNKVSAVAGGQANSITDVVSGLGAMAEAAQQANLSIDQTIGVVQVLGQVTSKSSSEIATSFKNLVGSVDSVGAIKALKKYGIGVKDAATGELRNILDIYTEIQEKIKSGVIPESNVKALVKAIAGGPRRAPDAAALLANVDAIKQAAAQAGQATNEALVANAKYLDTIESKITQIQVKFDTFVQKAFGPALKGFVTDLASVIGNVLGFLSKLNPEIIKTVLGFATLLIAIKGVTTIFKFFGGAVGDILNAFKLFDAAAAVGTSAFKLTGTTAQVASAEAVAAFDREIIELDKLIIAHRAAAEAALLHGETEVAAAESAAAANAIASRTAARALSPVGIGGTSATASKFSKFGGALLGAGVGAGIGAATGGTVGTTVGGGLLGGGLSLLAAPIPIPHLKAIAVAMIAVGGALTLLTGKSKEAETAQADLSQQVLTSLNQYKQAQSSISDITANQASLRKDYADLTAKGTTNNIAAINNKVVEYAQSVKDLRDANEALSTSFDDLSKNGSKLNDKFGSQIKLAKAGTLSPEAIKNLQKDIYAQLFAEVYKDDLAAQTSAKIPFKVAAPLPATGSTQATTTVAAQYVGSKGGLLKVADASTENLDLNKLTNASDILKLFSRDATKVTGSFELTSQNIALIEDGLSSLAGSGGEFADRAKVALTTFQQMSQQVDILANAELFTKQQDIFIQSKVILGQLNADEAKQGQSNLKIYQQLFDLASKLPSVASKANNTLGAFSPADLLKGTSEEAQAKARSLLVDDNGDIKTGKTSIKDAREVLIAIGATNGLRKDGVALSDAQVAAIANIFGIETDIGAALAKQVTESEALIVVQENLGKLAQSALDTLAQKSGDIQKRFLTGDITKKMRDSLLAAAKATNVLDNQVLHLLGNMAENQDVLTTFENQLSKIPGLENLVGASADQAGQLLLAWFDSMDLTGKGAQRLGGRIAALIAIINALPAFKQVLIQVRTDFIQTEGNDPNSRQIANNAQKNSLAAEMKKIQNLVNNLFKDMGNINSKNGTSFTSNTGSKGSKAAKAAGPGLDVSNLDLPDEIANAENRTGLIQEAIKRARALQHKIPGADKEAKNDVVELLKGTQRILEVRGVKDDLLRKALEELAAIEKKKLEFDTKADTIRRIRVGAGDFAALANVPLNNQTGVSVGGPNGPISINLNINGQILTPAQFAELANQIAAAIKRQLGG